jgi:hypothetical protein
MGMVHWEQDQEQYDEKKENNQRRENQDTGIIIPHGVLFQWF